MSRLQNNRQKLQKKTEDRTVKRGHFLEIHSILDSTNKLAVKHPY